MAKKICLWGDSIAYGAWDKEGGWFARLRKHYYDVNDDLAFYNLAVNGETTETLLDHFEAECEARRPDICLIEVGVNDSSAIGKPDNPKVAFSRFKKNINKICKVAKKYSGRVVFLGITPVDEAKANPVQFSCLCYYTNESVLAYNQAINDLCDENRLQMISLFDVVEERNLPDGLHPDESGNEKIFEAVKEQVVI